MRTYATKDNPELRRAEQQLAGLRAQVAKMEHNTGEPGNSDLELPTRKLPQAELEYLRLRAISASLRRYNDSLRKRSVSGLTG